jgi:hypothetical protein
MARTDRLVVLRHDRRMLVSVIGYVVANPRS